MRILISVISLLIMTQGCNKKSDGSGSSGSNNNSSTNFTIAGKSSSPTIFGPMTLADSRTMFVAKTITHVMAVSPMGGGLAERFISTVDSAGSFSLPVKSGKPYLIVFIAKNSGLTGIDMIAGTLKTGELDSLAPLAAGSTDLGNVSVDGTTRLATMTLGLTELLASLSLSSDAATYLGGVDDLALRLANPDVDGNGEIDFLENKNYSLDFHMRGTVKVGSVDATLDDVATTFLPSNSTITMTLSTPMAVYANSFDSTDYIGSGGSSLANGGDYKVFTSAGNDVTANWSNDGFSGGTFSDMRQWGPNYNHSNTHELPGSGVNAVTLKWTLGASGQTLTFSNVKTKTSSQITQNGMILPFFHFNTSDSSATGTIQSIAYEWRKLSSGTWVAATLEEVSLAVGSSGGYLMLYTQKGSGIENGVAVTFPKTTVAGTISWNTTEITHHPGVSDLSVLTPRSFCSTALSYDDQLGLRIFGGGVAPGSGVTICP